MVNKIILFLKTLNEKQLLLLIIGITFGLRLYAVLMAQGIANDSAAYGFMARDFLKGHFIKGLSIPGHPLYPVLMALFSFDTTHVEMAGRLLSLFFGSLTIIPLFYLVKEAIGEKEAIFSALLYSFQPYLVTYSGMLLTEATYWGWLILSVYLFWTGLKKEKLSRIVLSGLFLGLAYLTRPEGIGYVLVYLIWIALEDGLRKKWPKKLTFMGGLILTVLIFVIPYVIYIHQETGQWLISKKGVGIQSQLFKKSVEEVDPSRDVEPRGPIKENSEIRRITLNVVRFLPFVIYHYLRAYHFALWLFLFLGLIRTREKGMAGELFIASLVFFHLFSLSAFTHSTIRFSVPLIPLSLFWAGAGVLEIRKYSRKMKISDPEKLTFLLVLFFILIQLPQSFRPERSHRAGQKEVGLWLKMNTPRDAIIMSNSPIEAFYAEREFVLLPQGVSTPGERGKSYGEIMQFAKEKVIRYILTNRFTSEMSPDFKESIRSTDLKEFYRYKERDGSLIIVYEVVR